MLKFIFYFCGFILMVINLYNLVNIQTYIGNTKLVKNIKDNNIPTDIKWLIIRRVMHPISVLIWVIVGLFTFNWVVFICYILYDTSINVIKKIKLSPVMGTILLIFNWVCFILFIGFVIINAYYLKIDLFELIKNLF